MSQPRILIVHADAGSLTLLSSMLRSLGHPIEEAPNDRAAARLMDRGGVDVVLAGVDPADPDALELLTYARRKFRHVPVILLFPAPSPERAKEALRLGALSVLRYPVPATELRAAVTQALGSIADPAAQASSPASNPSAPSSTAPQSAASAQGAAAPAVAPILLAAGGLRPEQVARDLGMVGTDPSLRLALEMTGTIAPTRTPVLIVGERGTGKALLSRTIHALSTRSDRPFVTVDCSAMSQAHRDRELENGHAHNHGGSPYATPRPDPAFDWPTKLTQAHGGTLFLNDVSALSEALQLQLLNVLQDRETDLQGRPADVRVLMSTNHDLLAMAEQGRFRQDLFHRASVVALKLPPLRLRGGDVELIAEVFRSRFSLEYGKGVVGFTRDALEVLIKHDWPGNVRELEGVIQRGVSLCQGARITSGHLAPSLSMARPSRPGSAGGRPTAPEHIRPLKEALEEPEKRIIIAALQALNWNRQETARVLDINRTTLYKKMKKYGLLVDEPIWVN